MSERKDYEEQNKQEEESMARQEQYYWAVLHEFVAMCKVFGMTRIAADIKKIREQVEGVKEEKRIVTLG